MQGYNRLYYTMVPNYYYGDNKCSLTIDQVFFVVIAITLDFTTSRFSITLNCRSFGLIYRLSTQTIKAFGTLLYLVINHKSKAFSLEPFFKAFGKFII